MHTSLVMSVIGTDRPGLVELIASRIKGCGGNWLESRMCHLGGQFAGILHIDVSLNDRESLIREIQSLESEGLSVLVKDSGEAPAEECQQVAVIEIVGQDRPGIVSQISNAFAKRGVNVEELNTECRSAPMSGEPLFEARARVCIPQDCDTDALRSDLETIAADLMVDVSFDSA